MVYGFSGNKKARTSWYLTICETPTNSGSELYERIPAAHQQLRPAVGQRNRLLRICRRRRFCGEPKKVRLLSMFGPEPHQMKNPRQVKWRGFFARPLPL